MTNSKLNAKLSALQRNLSWYSFIIVPIITLCVLVYLPTLKTFYYSTTNMTTFGTEYQFIGFRNFRNLINSSSFLNALKNTFLLAIYSLLTIPLGFLLANTINQLGRGRTQQFFRVMFYMPHIMSGVSIVLIFQYVLRGNGGLLNTALSSLFGKTITIGWLSDANISHIGVTLISIWSSLGYSMLMNLASLQSIPGELYEAASIDGATHFQSMLHITIPSMRGCFSFLLITGIINGFSRFTDLYVLGGNSCAGRPNATLQTLLMYIYQFSFESPQYGVSSAGAAILFIIVLALTLLNTKLTGILKEE